MPSLAPRSLGLLAALAAGAALTLAVMAIDAGRFQRAWGRLGPAVQARSPGFQAWRAGYATTLSNRVEDLRVEPSGAVRRVLVAVDRTPCGTTTERRFEVLWYLDRDGRTFTARDLDSVQLAGVDPALACGQRRS